MYTKRRASAPATDGTEGNHTHLGHNLQINITPDHHRRTDPASTPHSDLRSRGPGLAHIVRVGSHARQDAFTPPECCLSATAVYAVRYGHLARR